MVNPNRITQDAPELKGVLLGFLESASSLCDMTNTTMTAAPSLLIAIQGFGRVLTRPWAAGVQEKNPSATRPTLASRVPCIMRETVGIS